MEKQELEMLATLISDKLLLTQKTLLTSEEASKYMGISMSHLYKLTFLKLVPHSKPTGKLCYFERAELDEWMKQNRVLTESEANLEANAYILQRK